jgi:ABC-type multidrug transport system fused ATPase/permease subunit
VKNLSCTLGVGQTIVVVGTNGSGKSSLIKLLARLHPPSSGDILIDGTPADEYKLHDLRQAIALFSQDQWLLPLSCKENITVGRPYEEVSHERMERAARLGGAHDFISKFHDKYETTLTPVNTKLQYGLGVTHPLHKVYEEVEKYPKISGVFYIYTLLLVSTDLFFALSGGEMQRLVAARTFMRISDEKIRLIIVDEPSSAMDPAGEYELFEHLREAQEGRTMVFITHRFGHLTKHADMIM